MKLDEKKFIKSLYENFDFEGKNDQESIKILCDFSKEIYNRLVHWMVKNVNKKLSVSRII